MDILGIDIGGSGIKGAPVNIETGKLVAERIRIPTPTPSSPEKVAESLIDVVKHFDWMGPVGSGFPAVVNNGMIFTASNIDKNWIGTNASEMFTKITGCDFVVINDADAALLSSIVYAIVSICSSISSSKPRPNSSSIFITAYCKPGF